MPNAASYGYPVAEAELYSGSSLPGFDPSIWNFREGEYPDLFFEFEDLIEMPAVDRIELDKTDLTLEIGDAIVLNERVVREDLLTSVHVDEYIS